MIDDGIRRRAPLQRAALMAWLAAGFLVRGLAQQAGGARRLLQPIAGGRFAAVAAIEPNLALKFADTGDQRRILRKEAGNARLQLRTRRLVAGDLFRLGRRRRAVHKRCHGHLDSHPPVTAQ
jgi:hypothetical protein